MTAKRRIFSLPLFAALIFPAVPADADEFDLLRERWVAMQTGGAGLPLSDPVLAAKSRLIGETANQYWKSLERSPDRANLWNDRPIAGKSANLNEHYERLEAMALAYVTKGSGLQGNAQLAQAVKDGLDWLHDKYFHPGARHFGNWWEWEIGIPLSLNNSISYLFRELGPERVAKFLAAIDAAQPGVHMSGANRLWESEVILLRGILGRNKEKIAEGIAGLDQVLAFNTRGWGDGFYEDGSFIQHGRIPYNGGYGKSLFRDIVDVLYLLAGSPWEVRSENRNNVFRWAREAYAPFLYKGEMMDMVRGREIAQPSRNSHKIGHQTMHPFVRLARFAPPEEATYFQSLLKSEILADTHRDFYADVPLAIAAEARKILADPAVVPAPELVAHRQFPMMARVVHRRPGFGFGLSLNSSRVGRYEAINSTNGKGWHTSDGMTYLYNADLGHYADNFWPTADLRRLPGTTVAIKDRKNAEGNNTLSPHNWVGGTDLGGSGIAGMHLQGFDVSLEARKSWFMFGDVIVALGADIRSTDGRGIETIVENRRLNAKGDNALTVDGRLKSSAPGWNEAMKGVHWVHLQGSVPGSDIGYYFPGGSPLRGLRESRTGKWSAICSASGDRDDTEHTRNYLTLWIDHGPQPNGATYAYVLLPGKSAAETAAYARAPGVEILENSARAQAVRDRAAGLTGVNFWTDESHAAGGLTSDKKAAVMMQEVPGEILLSLSDPTQANKGSIELELDRSATSVQEVSAGVTVKELQPKIRISVAVGKARGGSFRVRFATENPAPAPVALGP